MRCCSYIITELGQLAWMQHHQPTTMMTPTLRSLIEQMYNPKVQLRNSDIVLAYTFLRLVFGINMFVHGLVRLPNISGFVESQVGLYKEIAIPPLLIAAPLI